MLVYYLIATAITIVTILLCWCVKKFNLDKKGIAPKVFAYGFMLVFAIRCLSGTINLAGTVGLNMYSPFGKSGQAKVLFSLFSIWTTYAVAILLSTYSFFKDKVKSLTGLVKFFVVPIYAIA